MEHRIERTGASVEEAVEQALAELGASRDEVAIHVLESGSPRLLGLFGRREARVRVERLVHKHADLRDLTIDLLGAMGIPATVELQRTEDTIEVLIHTDGLDGLLIGRRGQTLAALQHVLSRMASREFGLDGHVVVDVGDYRKRRETHLTEKAKVLADKVRATGREFSFEPMHAPDRRIVHQAAAEVEGVRSYTVGQGLHRSVVITPDPGGQRAARAERHAEEGTV
jgi:spoIIIJ-associated protein